jgi:hypothetical protein
MIEYCLTNNLRPDGKETMGRQGGNGTERGGSILIQRGVQYKKGTLSVPLGFNYSGNVSTYFTCNNRSTV